MKKTLKKAIAVLLTVLMVVFSVPMSALAVDAFDYGSYAPDLALQFGTFHFGADYWTDVPAAITSTDVSLCGLYDVPVDFDAKIDPATGAASGKLYIDKDKANKANEVLYPDGTDPVTEDIVYGVGDYFTASVVVKNVTELKMLMAAIQYSENIEPAGVFTYRDGRQTKTALGSVSECTAKSGTMTLGGTSPIDTMSIYTLYGKEAAGIDNSADAPSFDLDNRYINMSFGNGSQVNADLHDDYFADPNTGDLNGYTYNDRVIVDTFIFKIVGEGDITFNLFDTDNTKLSNYMGCSYIAKTEESASPENYSTYAINTYGNADGSENPGSAKMTFMGYNANVGGGEETHTHDYKSEVTTPATCTTEGVRTYTCQSTTGTCDKPTYTETIPVDPTAHDFSIEKEIVPGKDCVTTGKTTMECSRCGETTEVDNDVVGNHVYGEPVITKPASCTEEGIKTYTCVYHENESYTESIPMIPHSYENKEIERKDATCTTDGYVITADVCTVCGAEKENSRVNTTLNATDHDWGEWIIDTPATETTEGSKHRVCKNDPTHTETEIIPVVECKHEGTTHEVDVEVVKAATCNAEGIKTVNVICDVCNNVIETKEVAIPIDENNHVGTTSTRDDVTLVATCQATGLKNVVTVCDDCGKDISVEEDVVIPKDADNHVGETTTRDVVITEATCGVDGLKNIETVCGCGTVLSTEENVPIPATGNHTWGDEFEVVTAAPSFDAEGSKDIKHTCSVCDLTETIRTESIDILKSYTVTVDAADMGTVTLDGTDVSNGGSVKFAPGSKVTLTAEAFDGAAFIGWTANGSTLVSTDAEFTTTVLANVKYTPVFEVATDSVFTVTFVDAFGNVVGVYTSDKGIDVPAAPARPGYVAATENGWSMTTDEIKALTSSATVTAQYVKAEEATYTVKAAGCDITANGQTIADELSVPYDTKVTVTNTSATAWIVKDAKTGEEVKVAYGDSYTFFVTADITLTYDTEAVVATPQVANVGVEAVGTAPRIQAAFKATRTMADDCQYIASGFVYGKGDLGAITLDNVDGRAVKASYNKTDSEQFILTYGLSAQQGTMTAVAFLAYVDANGVNQVAYAAPMTFTY